MIDVYQALSFQQAEELEADEFVEMGLALIHLNRFKDADMIMFPQAQDQDAKCQSLLVEWGRIFQDKFNYPDARKSFREALEENPSFADGLVALAENYLEDFKVGSGRYSMAQKQLEKDMEHLTGRDTYVEVVKSRAQVDQLQNQNTASWDYTYKLRDKFNGH